MAHQTNVTQVKGDIPASADPAEKVHDPICGKTFPRRESKHMIFRENETLYFCSKDCQQDFLFPARKAA